VYKNNLRKKSISIDIIFIIKKNDLIFEKGYQMKIAVGKIVKSRGLKGEVIVLVYGENINDFMEYENFFIEKKHRFEKLSFLSRKPYKGNRISALIQGVTFIDDANLLIEKEIYIENDEMEELNEDEFYYYQAIGTKVYHKNILLGEVKEVKNFGSCDILELDYKDSEGKIRTLYLPVLKEYLETFDLKEKKIIYNENYELPFGCEEDKEEDDNE